jgi:hypothetical protein
MNPNPLCIFGHEINKEQLNGWYVSIGNTKKRVQRVNPFMFLLKTVNIPHLFEASRSFQVMALRNLKEIRKLKP